MKSLTRLDPLVRIVRREFEMELAKFRDTGELADGMTVSSRKTGSGGSVDFQISVRFDKPYARIQDEGGTIAPKTRQAMAIPVDEATKRLGPPRTSGLRLFRIGDTLYERISRTRKRPRYVLKRKVRIVGHHYSRKALRRSADKILKRFDTELTRLLA